MNAQGWQTRSLASLAEYINGYAFKPEDWKQEGLPIVRIEQLRNPDGIFDYCGKQIPSCNIIDDGDLIFSWSASLLLRVWKHGRAALNQHLFKVIERANVDRLFLKALIEFHLPALTAASHGSTMQHITRKELSRFTALVPNLEVEQEKIAAVLSAMDRAIEQTESLIAKQEHIKTGLMRDLLTFGVDENGDVRAEGVHKFKDSPLGRIPIEWNVRPLGEIAHVIDPNPSHRYPPSVDAGVPIASTENFDGDNEFDLRGADHVPRSVLEAQMMRCQYGTTDVVFARKGRIGLARPYGTAEKVFSHTVVLIKSKKSSELTNEFLLWAVRDFKFFTEIDKRMNSNSGVPTLGVKFLSAISLRVPDVDEQRRIAQVISQSETAIQREREVRRKLLSLKAALMQDLLTGRKRVTPLLKAEHQPAEQVA